MGKIRGRWYFSRSVAKKVEMIKPFQVNIHENSFSFLSYANNCVFRFLFFALFVLEYILKEQGLVVSLEHGVPV